MKVAGDANTGREDDHTPFRHHIRTIHTRDNDYAGVTVEKPDVQSMTQTADTGNYLTTDPVSVDVVEGETFGFYTLRLKSQPRKVQRQAGTNPNAPVITGAPGAARPALPLPVPSVLGRPSSSVRPRPSWSVRPGPSIPVRPSSSARPRPSVPVRPSVPARPHLSLLSAHAGSYGFPLEKTSIGGESPCWHPKMEE